MITIGAALLLQAAPSAHALTPGVDLSQYGHRSWRYRDGYFNGTPLSIAQTSDGYLWIGTSEGLERFDGVRFVPVSFPKGEALPSTEIWSLAGASDGSLWIGTTRGIARLAHGQLTTYPAAGSNRIYQLTIAPDGTVWAALENFDPAGHGLCAINRGKVRCFGAAEGISNPASAVAADRGGSVWLGPPTAVERWTPAPGKVSRFNLPALTGNADMDGVTGLAVDHDGSIWVGLSQTGPSPSLLKITNGVLTPAHFEGIDVNGLVIHRLLIDSNDALWIATAEHGVLRVIGHRGEGFSEIDGLTSSFVTSLFEDHEGDIWVATSGGLDCFYDTAVISVSKAEGLNVVEVDGLAATRSGNILIKTGAGLKVMSPQAGTIASDPLLSSGQISGLYEDPLGGLWVGDDNQLLLESGHHLTRIPAPHHQAFGLTNIAGDGRGIIWVDSLRGFNRYLDRIRNSRVAAEFSSETVPPAHDIVGSPSGGVWLSLLTGDIAYFDGSRVQAFRFRHGTKDTAHQIIVATDGTVLAATTYGLIGERAGVERVLNQGNGLPCTAIFSLVLDLKGNLWMSADCGLIEITARQLVRWWVHPNVRIATHLYDATDGAQPGFTPFHGAARSSDGRLWFANGFGLQTIDPAHIPRNAVPPPVHIEQIIADRRAYAPIDGLRLPALTRDLEIDYTALSFAAPRKVAFRYRLVGHDPNWVDPGIRREAFYNDLAPGQYVFRVIAANNSGVWNRVGAELPFYIVPAFYQTLWFKISVALGVLAILWLAYLARIRAATAAVHELMGERMMERERIARDLHDTLLQGFQGVLLRIHAVVRQLSDPKRAEASLAAALERADQVLTEARLKVRDLLPEDDAALELSEELKNFGKVYVEGSSVDFRAAATGSPRPLRPPLRYEFLRVGREAVINAFLHAQATSIVVAVNYGRSVLTLEVRDNGRGIPSDLKGDGRPDHWGLRNMRAVAHSIGATLSIRDEVPSGTAVTLSIAAERAYAQSACAAVLQAFRRITGRREKGPDAGG